MSPVARARRGPPLGRRKRGAAGSDVGLQLAHRVLGSVFGAQFAAHLGGAAHAARVGEHFMARLRGMQREFRCIGEVRGKGLMIGMELIEEDADRTPARQLCDALVTQAWRNGLLLLACGVSTVRFMPPLSVSEAEIDEAVMLLRTSLDEALRGEGA